MPRRSCSINPGARDVDCGAGLTCELLATRGAQVVGVDAAAKNNMLYQLKQQEPDAGPFAGLGQLAAFRRRCESILEHVAFCEDLTERLAAQWVESDARRPRPQIVAQYVASHYLNTGRAPPILGNIVNISTCSHFRSCMRRLLLLLTLAALPLLSHAIEEPDYEVIRTFDKVELRRYAPYLVAEVVLNTSAEQAGSQAFPILAGYIFGKNKGEKTFAMTAPVTQAASPARLDINSPATQTAVAGGMRVQFVLPKEVALATAPEPMDARVQLRMVPAGIWAVLRYSGTWSRSNYVEHLGDLRAALEAAGVATEGEPVWARYNAPFTPWFMRRNEIWLLVR